MTQEPNADADKKLELAARAHRVLEDTSAGVQLRLDSFTTNDYQAKPLTEYND